MRLDIPELQVQFDQHSAIDLLQYFLENYRERIILGSSMGAEDQVLTDLVLKVAPGARIFTLDTGRLPQETYAVINTTMRKYQMHYEIYFPETRSLEELSSKFGPDLFYESVSDRKKCCQVRKVEPLQRVLKTVDVWITGLRREQAATRTGLRKIEWDETNGLLKLNPLVDWTTAEVWEYIHANHVPFNKLHDQGYPSIGCAPCTRGVKPGEDIRAGRWWWEAPEHKECGLHYGESKFVQEDLIDEPNRETGKPECIYFAGSLPGV